MTKCKILLIGCGQLGSRHLQAVATLREVGEIHVVDPRPESLELARARLREVSDTNPAIVFQWHTEPMACCAGGDLCIVATQAKDRPVLIKRIAARFSYKKFLIEKIVSQSIGEYQDLMEYVKINSLLVWVHCQTRTYGIHRYVKSCLDPVEPITFTEIGGNFGLACNGIHYADLFLFYDGGHAIHGAGAKIDPVLHSSKRGSEVFDLSGSLYGFSDKGSHFILSYAPQHRNSDVVTVSSSKGKFIIDIIAQSGFEWKEDTGWKPIPIMESDLVSYTSKRIVADILSGRESGLPTLEECFPAHRYILSELLPHFNLLLGTSNTYCPVT
ncbi:MAG: hypothetical protein Q7S48_03390 [bacterium]|nr:hypothetical protein [bacterium]